MIKKILCPMEQSSNAKASMAYAISLAQEHRADLIFFHVTHFPSLDFVYPCDPTPFFIESLPQRFSIEELFKNANSMVLEFVQANFGSETRGLSWKIKIGLGKITGEIVAAAVEEKVTVWGLGSIYLCCKNASARNHCA